ncbi:MAG: aminoglycoside phosphotransferase family protein [Bacteroidota bacterium]
MNSTWPYKDQLMQNLSDCGLLCPQSMTDGSLVIHNLSSRNMNFLVDQAEPVFIKIGLDAIRKEGLRTEARLYGNLPAMNREFPLARFLPELRHYDEAQGVLITAGLMGTTALQQLLMDPKEQDLAASGKEAGLFLREMAQHRPPATSEAVRDDAPWPFTLAAPDKNSFMQFSAAAQEIVQIIQRNAPFARQLEHLRQQWQPTGIIHNDFKPDNVLVLPQRHAIRVIDWEISGYGDHCWDLGTLWAAVIKIWIDSAEKAGEPDMRMRKKPEDLFPFTQSLWKAYSEKQGLAECTARLIRSMHYAGVGLLKIAVETADFMLEPNRRQLLYLQVAQNLMQQPVPAAKTLLGLA